MSYSCVAAVKELVILVGVIFACSFSGGREDRKSGATGSK